LATPSGLYVRKRALLFGSLLIVIVTISLLARYLVGQQAPTSLKAGFARQWNGRLIVSDSPMDTDGDGLLDTLIVWVVIDVSKPSSYTYWCDSVWYRAGPAWTRAE